MALDRKEHLEKKIAEAEVYDVSCAVGLSSEEVEKRKTHGLTNKTPKAVTKSYGKIVFDNLVNPLNIILIIIFVFMLFGNLTITHYFFIVILAANSGIGLYQDLKARKLVDKLKVITEPKCNVIIFMSFKSLFINLAVCSATYL